MFIYGNFGICSSTSMNISKSRFGFLSSKFVQKSLSEHCQVHCETRFGCFCILFDHHHGGTWQYSWLMLAEASSSKVGLLLQIQVEKSTNCLP